MLSGECQQNIDSKGRIIVPAKFKSELGQRCAVTKGLDNCLFLFPMPQWQELEDKLKDLSLADSRDIKRFFVGSKEDLEVDNQGRILIPANLRSFAKLEKDIVLVGLGNRAEIWNRGNWDELNDKFISNPDIVAMKMEELGL